MNHDKQGTEKRRSETREAEARDSRSDERRMAEAMQRYMAALDAGQVPDRQALLADYPDLAAELASRFDSLDFIFQVSQEIVHRVEAKAQNRSAQFLCWGVSIIGGDMLIFIQFYETAFQHGGYSRHASEQS